MDLTLIADGLMIAAALGAAVYCMVLSRRLKRFNNHKKGMGRAIAVLSAQVDDLTKTLTRAEETAKNSAQELAALTARSDDGAKRLEMLLATLHDLPDPDKTDEEPLAKFIRSESEGPIAEAAQ